MTTFADLRRGFATVGDEVAIRVIEMAADWIEAHPNEDAIAHLRATAARLRRVSE